MKLTKEQKEEIYLEKHKKRDVHQYSWIMQKNRKVYKCMYCFKKSWVIKYD